MSYCCCVAGPAGPALRWPTSDSLVPGIPVLMLGFPEAAQTGIKDLECPIAAKGHVCATAPSMEVAVADYHGGMHSGLLADSSLLVY